MASVRGGTQRNDDLRLRRRKSHRIRGDRSDCVLRLLGRGGFGDWRLPTYKELHSVLEFPPKNGSVEPEIVAIDGYRPYLLCRVGWQPDARVLLMHVHDGNPIIPSATSTYPIICVRGH